MRVKRLFLMASVIGILFYSQHFTNLYAAPLHIIRDVNETSIPDGKDFKEIRLSVRDGHLYTSIYFFGEMNTTVFYYYFSTDNDPEADILVRCMRNRFEVAKETRPGLYNRIVYRGTPEITSSSYKLHFPWFRVFYRKFNIKLWLFCMDGRDRLPNQGSTSKSWWSFVSCTKHVQSLYQGTFRYKPTPEGWWMKCAGIVFREDNRLFPQILHFTRYHTSQIRNLLNSIGAPTQETWNDNTIWNRVVTVWQWLQNNQLRAGTTAYNEARRYRGNLGHWPSLNEIAIMYDRYNGIHWGTCTSRASLFATLLMAVGIPSDKIAVVEAYTEPEYSQHYFVVIYLNNHWYYLDPMYISLNLSNQNIISLGHQTSDYVHPYRIYLIPGSRIPGVPLVE
jgi:hypothetical protein